jgi:hypothetical protein
MPCNTKGKIWLDIPRLGTMKKGWEYRGYIGTDNFDARDYEQVKMQINDFWKQGLDTKVKEGRYPNRWDLWTREHRQGLPKNTERFLK